MLKLFHFNNDFANLHKKYDIRNLFQKNFHIKKFHQKHLAIRDNLSNFTQQKQQYFFQTL